MPYIELHRVPDSSSGRSATLTLSATLAAAILRSATWKAASIDRIDDIHVGVEVGYESKAFVARHVAIFIPPECSLDTMPVAAIHADGDGDGDA